MFTDRTYCDIEGCDRATPIMDFEAKLKTGWSVWSKSVMVGETRQYPMFDVCPDHNLKIKSEVLTGQQKILKEVKNG